MDVNTVSLALAVVLGIVVPLTTFGLANYIKRTLLKLKADLIAHVAEELKQATKDAQSTFVTKELWKATQQLWQNQVETLTRDVAALQRGFEAKQ